eukprot:g23227.t1
MGKVTKASLRDQPWDVILQVLQDAQVPSVALLGAAVDALGRQRRWQTVVELLHCMEEATLQANIVLLNAALNSEKGHQWLPALRVLHQSIIEAIPQDAALRSTVLSSCEKCHRWRMALSLLHTSRQESRNNFKQTGLVKRGTGMLLIHFYLDLINFNAVISSCEKDGQWQWALQLLQEIRRSMLRPNVVSYNAAISACEKGGAWEYSVEVLKEIARQALRPDGTSFNGAISAAARGRQWQVSLELFHAEAGALKPDLVAFGAAVTACEAGGKWDLALSILEHAKAMNIELNDVVFNAAISACEKGGRWPMALMLLEQMNCLTVEASLISFNAAMSACAQGGPWYLTLALFDCALFSNLDPDEFTLSAVVDACARCQQWQQAISLFCFSEPDLTALAAVASVLPAMPLAHLLSQLEPRALAAVQNSSTLSGSESSDDAGAMML